MSKVLPEARIVVDNFHVLSKANAAFETVRRNIAKADKKHGLGLKRSHKLFAKRATDLDDAQYLTVSGWLNSFRCWPPEFNSSRPFLGCPLAYGRYESMGWTRFCLDFPKPL